MALSYLLTKQRLKMLSLWPNNHLEPKTIILQKELTDIIVNEVENAIGNEIPDVEKIQDTVEKSPHQRRTRCSC